LILSKVSSEGLLTTNLKFRVKKREECSESCKPMISGACGSNLKLNASEVTKKTFLTHLLKLISIRFHRLSLVLFNKVGSVSLYFNVQEGTLMKFACVQVGFEDDILEILKFI